jgi:hypothetical protein
MGPANLSSSEFAELLRVTDIYDEEAHKCLASGAFLAGCAMLAAELEAVLLLTASVHTEEIDESPFRPEREGKPKALISWKFWELLRVARDLGWIQSDWFVEIDTDGQLIRANDHADLVRKVRNLMHPARYIQDIPGGQVNEADLDICYRVVEEVIDRLGTMLGPAMHQTEVH